jgi:exodeoxyribonuclease-1
MQTYLFYDIETSGLNKSFDQILQFAAIRTDLNLNELERYNIKIKLNPDTIPSPFATIVHRIGISATHTGIPEIDAIQQIHGLLNTPGTISLGYNTLGFDDEFLRFSFYRNLLSPYTHQFGQCSRMDLYPMTTMYHLFKNDVLTWPQLEGKTKLKLELLNKANQLATGQAHDAMVDVEVTLALAKIFYQSREMWDYLIGYFNKSADLKRYQDHTPTPAGTYPEAIMVHGKFGAAAYFHAPVYYIGDHMFYNNQSLWLRLDNPELAETTSDNIQEKTWVTKKKWGEPPFILPTKERFQTNLSSERKAQAEANKSWLNQNPDLFKKIIEYHRSFTFPNIPHADVESRLYIDSFYKEEENTFCRRFHTAAPDEKARLTENLQQPKLKMLATRLLARHFPQVLTERQKEEFDRHMEKLNSSDDANAIVDFKGGKHLSPLVALKEIAEIRQSVEIVLD